MFDVINKEPVGFGYSCSDDGLNWSVYQLVPVPGGARTPFGLVPLTAQEIKIWKPIILQYGIMTEVDFSEMLWKNNTSLQWVFYTQYAKNHYEDFRASIVQLVY